MMVLTAAAYNGDGWEEGDDDDDDCLPEMMATAEVAAAAAHSAEVPDTKQQTNRRCSLVTGLPREFVCSSSSRERKHPYRTANTLSTGTVCCRCSRRVLIFAECQWVGTTTTAKQTDSLGNNRAGPVLPATQWILVRRRASTVDGERGKERERYSADDDRSATQTLSDC